MTDKKTEALKLALKRAFNLGQTYWQQAYSEYTTNQWKNADVTLASFSQLVEDTIRESLAEQPADPFGIEGGLVAIKTLLSRDPCAHAEVAIAMIDAMLAEQPAQHEPVAWIYDTTLPDGEVIKDWTSIAHPLDVTLPDENVHNIRPLYAAPKPSKPCVGLTKEDRYKAIRPLYCDDATAALAACHSNDEYEAIEAKLRSKNGY